MVIDKNSKFFFLTCSWIRTLGLGGLFSSALLRMVWYLYTHTHTHTHTHTSIKHARVGSSSSMCTSRCWWPHQFDVGIEDLPPTIVLEPSAEPWVGWGNVVRLVLSVLVYPWTSLPTIMSLSLNLVFIFYCYNFILFLESFNLWHPFFYDNSSSLD